MFPAAERQAVHALRVQWRAYALTDLHGDVLDVGAGEGASLGALPHDARVTCLEPNARSVRRLRALTADRPGARVLPAPVEDIPLADASMDAVICSAVLCSASDQDQALRELHRVLRPGGRLVMLEHVAAERGTWMRRGQRLIAPASRWLDRGCDPARDTEAAVQRSAFTVIELRRIAARGPFGLDLPHLHAVLARRPSLNQ
ncbi:hypothetical protein VV02_05505 [Luteipulveratus mongoliensis]|uniref:Methyltransferase type 11 domain-containing protein n=2 Tax=Luteipulveratus mongoliensis TaxID=571913 RepID=A0A0K1JFS9_9MICO|nr:hypothetical protein VV02_05505 [Luteipulveratus mongoliensis]